MYDFRVRWEAERIANEIFESGGIKVMTGEEWRSLVKLARCSDKAMRYVQSVFEDVGLRTIERPRNQGDLVVVYHPRTYAGQKLDRALGRPVLEVTERWWAPIHRRKAS